MSQLATPTHQARPTGHTPWTVRVISTVVGLLSVVTSYGAIYFSFYFEDPNPGVGSWVFVTAFLAINVVAAVAAVGLYRGSRSAWKVLLAYGAAGILWCIAKLVFWSEEESLVFGAANALVLWLMTARPTRAHIA